MKLRANYDLRIGWSGKTVIEESGTLLEGELTGAEGRGGVHFTFWCNRQEKWYSFPIEHFSPEFYTFPKMNPIAMLKDEISENLENLKRKQATDLAMNEVLGVENERLEKRVEELELAMFKGREYLNLLMDKYQSIPCDIDMSNCAKIARTFGSLLRNKN